jgi:hypothetical protein
VHLFSLHLTRFSALTGRGTVPLSSFGGEGKGEEAVALRQHAKSKVAATRWKVSMNRSIQNGPPLPHLLLQRRRRKTTSVRHMLVEISLLARSNAGKRRSAE